MPSILAFALASVVQSDFVPSRAALATPGRSSAASPNAVARRSNVDEAIRSFVIDVRVEFGGETLYNGPLHLAPGFVTTYSEMLNETPALICRGSKRYQSRDKRALRIQLSQWRSASEPIHVMVEFVRPAGLAGCAQAGTRTARTEQWVNLGPSESVALPGDGGLGVYLSRR